MFGAPDAIFISYSRSNSVFVDRLEADLETCDFYTWVDRRKFEDGQSWKSVLQEAIDLCDVVLVILSSASVTSNYVRMEYSYALEISKPVIPLQYQSCQIPDHLNHIESVDFKTDYEQGLSNLLAAVSRVKAEGQLLKQFRPDRMDYLRKQAQQAQKACQWRVAGGFWQASLGWDPQNSEARLSLQQCLREQGKEASSNGEWELAISVWKGLLQLKPDDAQAKRQLSLAQHNQHYAQYYEDARQFIAENEPSPACMQLRWLWQYAPYYGDPEGLTLKVRLTKPLRSPATLDEEEETRIAEEQKAELARAEREEAERRRREQEDAARRRREWEEAEKEAKAQVLRRFPDWFIKYELKTTRFPVWYGLFFLLSGSGTTVAIVTRSLPWALGTIAFTMLLAYILGHHRTIHQWPEHLLQYVEQRTGQPPSPPRFEKETSASVAIYIVSTLFIIVICSLVTFFFANYVSTLNYSAQQTDHFLWITHSWWLDRQIMAGLIIGATLSLTIALWLVLRQESGFVLGKALIWSTRIGFSVWLICSLLGLIFDWGWGLGSGWDFSLLGLVVGVIAGVGLGSSFAVWKQGKPIFSALF